MQRHKSREAARELGAVEKLTPYRVALCILIDLYTRPPTRQGVSRGKRQDLALFLLQEVEVSMLRLFGNMNIIPG